MSSLSFDGSTYSSAHDATRLGSQLYRVRSLMLDGQWRTLAELVEQCGGTVASVSARLRDLRKHRFGGYQVSRRARGPRCMGVFEYRVEVER